ncbi:hypothetical protein LXL04_008279 [Taraxacum kok-saghyz]
MDAVISVKAVKDIPESKREYEFNNLKFIELEVVKTAGIRLLKSLRVMGYKTSFCTRQKKFRGRLRRREIDVWNEGVEGWPCPLQEQITVLRFLTLKDLFDEIKGEILLLIRYTLDFFSKVGFKLAVDSFAEKANIDTEEPLDGSYMEYWGFWSKEPRETYWTFFCHKKLKALKEHTFQGSNALNITTTNQQPSSANQSTLGQSYTSTNRVHFFPQQRGQDRGHAMHSELRTSLNSGMISRLTMILSSMLRSIISGYLFKTGLYKGRRGIIKEQKTDEQQPLDRSLSLSTSSSFESIASRVKKRRRCSDENMNIQG